MENILTECQKIQSLTFGLVKIVDVQEIAHVAKVAEVVNAADVANAAVVVNAANADDDVMDDGLKTVSTRMSHEDSPPAPKNLPSFVMDDVSGDVSQVTVGEDDEWVTIDEDTPMHG